MPGNNHRKMERKLRTVILVILVISIGTAIGLVFTPLFHVQEAWCEGNNRVSQEEILGVAQVDLGKNIFAQSLSGIRKLPAGCYLPGNAISLQIFVYRSL